MLIVAPLLIVVIIAVVVVIFFEKRGIVGLLVVGGMVFLWVWSGSRVTTVAYRLTVAVEVNGEVHTGSGVVVTEWGRNPDFLGTEGPRRQHVRGEAVTVDLGEFGVLAVALTGRYHASVLPLAVFGNPERGEDFWHFIRELAKPKAPRDIPLDALPLMVLFAEPAEPNPVVCVSPYHPETAFPAGTQVKLVRATMAIVDEAMTTGVEKRLPWMAVSRRELVPRLTGPVWRYTPQAGLLPCQMNLVDLKSDK